VAAGAAEVVARIDIHRHAGIHPRVGALDVAPIVHLAPSERGAACAEALVLADLLAERLDLPVLLYGALAGGRTRAELRRGGADGLARRLSAGELAPDAGPPRLHPTAGATLVAARPPLGAFNVWLRPPATLADARRIAAALREELDVRALGLELTTRGLVQVSTNIEDLEATTPAAVLEHVARYAAPERGELVAPVPRAALAGWPPEVPLDAPPPIEDLLAGAGV
jgi:glutamate formiminotransferase